MKHKPTIYVYYGVCYTPGVVFKTAPGTNKTITLEINKYLKTGHRDCNKKLGNK